MSSLSRQMALLVAEAWQNLYANLSYVDFASYTSDNLVNAVLNYIKINYPDNFNDWITNSEFVIKIRTLAWLSQSLSYRLDLNVRENFIATATRRQSILNLAENVFYTPNRVTGAVGQLRVASVMTNQPLVDSNGDTIANVTINWNDPANVDWFEQFMLVMNAALTPRTQFGHPLTKFSQTPSSASIYILNSRAPSAGVYPFNVTVSGTSLPFAFVNVSMDQMTGVLSELPPNPTNAQMILYLSDGLGSGSAGTGFFLPIRQGTLNSVQQNFTTPQPLQAIDLGSSNCDNNTIFVQQLDTAGNVILNWTEVDTLFGQSVSFNTLDSSVQTIFEVHTLINDQIQVLFGDGKFGAIPTDNFRFWYRAVNPIPTTIQPTDINNQVFVIPYVNNNVVYFLTVAASLVAPISNGIATDSNLAITQAMGGAFAAQDRMVTGQDYNLFPLRDPSILKLNAVNRTYSGHSAYSKITDPTGYYSGVQLIGEDGRLFRQHKLTSQFVSALTAQITLDELVLQYLTPLIQSTDKSEIYYEMYDEVLTTGDPLWFDVSDATGVSTGNITRSNSAIVVGATATDEFQYCLRGTYLRYNGPAGPLIVVESVVGDGTTPGAITLERVIVNVDSNIHIFSLIPPFRDQFNNAEMSVIKGLLFNLQDFGISWNQRTQSWIIISNSDLNKTGDFSLQFQNNTNGSELDASWLIYLQYIPATETMSAQWKIVDRGISVLFESSRDVSFVYANSSPLPDPYTGKLVRDNVRILGSNEGRDSLHRLGLFMIGPCCPIIYDFTSDGVKSCYSVREKIEAQNIFIFVNNSVVVLDTDYTVIATPIGVDICFINIPFLGATISIRLNGPYVRATQYIVSTTADGATVFWPIVGASVVNFNNSFFFADGISQSLSDYQTPSRTGIATFYDSPALVAGVRVLGYALAGVQMNIFQISVYIGDGFTNIFSTNCPSLGQSINTVVVVIDGILQSPELDYSIDLTDTDARVLFGTPPVLNTHISIHAEPIPTFVKSTFFTAIANGVTASFKFLNFKNVVPPQIIVAIDGVVQRVTDDYTIDAAGITFLLTPDNERRIDVFVVYEALGFAFSNDNNSCHTTYLLDDYIWDVVGVELTPDGYTDLYGVVVAPDDSDFDGFVDDPFEFNDILIPDGITDLVLWRSVIENGFSVWNPIDQTTIPQATYGFEARTAIAVGVSFYSTGRQPGDIHLDQTVNQWLVADPISGNWIIAPNQNDFMSATGRSGLLFIWTHYPADNTRIDPSISNLIDMFILTVGYDTSYRNWVSGGFVGNAPLAPTTESLQNAYGYLNSKRMTDDSIIFHAISYLPLFGTIADPDHQGTFLAIRTIGSILSANDLVLRIIHSIDVFFQAGNQDLGATFYLTELIAFIHRACAPDLQSIVLVSKDGAPFGALFQIRCSSDQLFISVAQPSDIQIVTSYNDDNLNLTSL